MAIYTLFKMVRNPVRVKNQGKKAWIYHESMGLNRGTVFQQDVYIHVVIASRLIQFILEEDRRGTVDM